MASLVRVVVAVSIGVAVLRSAPVHAQLRDPLPAEHLVDGGSVLVTGSVLGERALAPAPSSTSGEPSRDTQLTGELATVIAWTRGGVDRTEGFRGPRWTNRWGGMVAARGALGSGEQPLEIEERGELALYVGSVGQTVGWQARPRLTDQFWTRQTDRLSAGAFVDFPGLGMIKEDHGDDLSAEAFPIYLAIKHELGSARSTTEAELAVVRVVGRPGDVRLIDHRVTVRHDGVQRAIAWDFEAISARQVELSLHSPWRLSGGIGLGVLTPLAPGELDLRARPHSIIPLARIGIAHHGEARLQSRRSEIGRPLVDDADLGVELSTLHRLVEQAGLDAGGQLTAWSSRPLAEHVSLRGEVMLGVAKRRLRPAMSPDMTPDIDPPAQADWVEANSLIVLARGEVGIAAELARGFAIEARIWAEHSERDDPTAPARWRAGIESGLVWRL